MADFWLHLFDTSDFPSRWNCGRWTAGHGWLHILADLGVWSAYVAIPCVLIYFASKKRDLPFRKIFWLFGAFILACGMTHLMEAIIFWWPAYRLAGIIKLITACVSWATALALIPITPLALSLRGQAELEREVTERQKAEAELRVMHAELERRVAERTEELSRANAALKAEIAVRQHVEQVLEGEREWFEVTLDSIGDAVIATNTDGQLTFLNRVARELTGFHESIAEHSLSDVFRAEAIEAGEGGAAASSIDNPDRAPTMRRQLVKPTGERVPIEERAAPIRDDEGHRLGTVLVFRDISDRRRAEDALLQANRHKDQFLAMLGHELRNPLAGIAGAAQVLELTGSPQAEAAEMRAIIQRQTAHMSRLIDDLLDVSRISRGKLQLRLERLDFAELARATADDFRRTIHGARVINVTIGPDPVWVLGDRTRLAQVLVNLLQNAEKFTNTGGHIDVAMHCENDPATVVIRVRDDGIGMSADTLGQIFEPFRQADESLDRSRGGLGLGLALVRGLVQLHGGHVLAHSAGLGHGAEFTIRLPIAAPAAGTDAPRPHEPDNQPAHRVLIIDDRRDASLPLQVLLEKLGQHVITAEDGTGGLAAARRDLPDLVLCDIGLPGGMNGYDVARALRSDPATAGAYLVAVTGYGQDEDRQRAREAGFDRHLTKPVGIESLRALLHDLRVRQA